MSAATRSWLRVFLAVALMGIAATILHARDSAEIIPARHELSTFPFQIAGWEGTPLPLTADELEVLGPGDFMVRDYTRASDGQVANLYVAYFPSQRTGDTIHSPKNCLPGSGWTPLQSGEMDIHNANGSTMSVNRYIVGKGTSRALVLYWYQAHGRVTANEYVAKIRLVEDAMRLNRTDGALVRVVVPFDNGGDVEHAQDIAVGFVGNIQPMLNRYVPD